MMLAHTLSADLAPSPEVVRDYLEVVEKGLQYCDGRWIVWCETAQGDFTLHEFAARNDAALFLEILDR